MSDSYVKQKISSATADKLKIVISRSESCLEDSVSTSMLTKNNKYHAKDVKSDSAMQM